MEKKLVVLPSEPIQEYIKKGSSWEHLEKYYNPGLYFDKVYCLSPWDAGKEQYGTLQFVRARPRNFHKIIRKIHPLVVRAYGGYHCADWAAFSKVKDIPVVVSVHDTNPNLIYEGIKYADCIICMEKIVCTAINNKLHIPVEKMFIMPNRVDTEIFCNKKDSAKQAQFDLEYGIGKHILHIGRKTEQKNLDTLIKALEYLPDEYKAIFIGQGDARPYEELAKRLGVISRCKFIPSIPNDELPYYYSWCDCFCTPSRWEGFGVVFIEAAACEAMVITSNIAPMNAYLMNGKNAILIDEYENPQKIANAILVGCQKSEKVVAMKKEARKVGLKFSRTIVDQQEVEIYKKVIKHGAENRRPKEWSIIWRSIRN